MNKVKKNYVAPVTSGEGIDAAEMTETKSAPKSSKSKFSSALSSGTAFSVFQEQATLFLSAFRTSLPWYIYNLFFFVWTVYTLPVVFIPDANYGKYLGPVFKAFDNVRTLGTQYLPYEALPFIMSAALVLEGLLLVLYIFCYRAYSKGGKSFDTLKTIIIRGSTVATFFGIPLLYVLATFWNCDYGTMTLDRYDNIKCFDSNNLIFGSFALAAMLLLIMYVGVSMLTWTETSLDKKSSFLSCHQIYFPIWEVLSWMIALFLGRTVFVKFLWGRPILFLLQNLTSCYFIFAELPFFNAFANSLAFGVSFGRALTSIVALVCIFVNGDASGTMVDINGIIFGSVAIAGLIGGCIVGALLMFLYTRLVIYRGKRAGQRLQLGEKVNLSMLEKATRLTIRNEKSRTEMVSFIKQAISLKNETSKLHLTLGICYIYFNTEVHQFAGHCFKKALSFRPNFFLKSSIILRYRDYERLIVDKTDSRRIYQVLETAKRRQKDIMAYKLMFWKQLVNSTSTTGNIAKLSQYAEIVNSYSAECDRYYNNLISSYPKNANVLRSYAEYLESVAHDRDQAIQFYDEADDIEEEEAESQFAKRKNERRFSKTPAPPGTATNGENSDISPGSNRRFSIDYLEDINDLESEASENRDFKKLDATRRAIMKYNYNIIGRIIAMSVVPAAVLYLVLILLLTTFNTAYNQPISLFSACRLQSVLFETLSPLRAAQYEYVFLNNTQSIQSQIVNTSTVLASCMANTYESRSGDQEKYGGFFQDFKEIRIPLQFIAANNTFKTFPTNASLYDATRLFNMYMTSMQTQTVPTSLSSNSFMYIWANRDLLYGYYGQFCNSFLKSYDESQANNYVITIVLAAVTAGFHVILFVFYIPAMEYVWTETRVILGLFHTIPKEVVGKIYHNLEDQYREDASKNTTASSCHPRFKIMICCAFILLVEAAVFAVFMYNNVVTVTGDTGSSSILSGTATVMSNVNKLVFDVREAALSGSSISLDYDSAVTKATITQMISKNRKDWNTWRFGDGDSSIEITGKSSTIDKLVKDNACNGTLPTLEAASCQSIAWLMDILYANAERLVMTADARTLNDRFTTLTLIEKIARVTTMRLQTIIDIYISLLGGGTIPIDDIWLVVVGCVLILFFAIPVNMIMSQHASTNHQIKQMLHEIPIDILETLPEINSFAIQGKLRRKTLIACQKKTSKKSDDNTLIEASNEAVFVCYQDGTIIETNNKTLKSFQCNSSDLIGANIREFFQTEDIDTLLKDVANSNGIVKETQAKMKTKQTFPVIISASTTVYNKKQTVVCFVRDITIEKKQTELIASEKQHSEELLLNILPVHIAARLKRGDTNISERIDDVSILFSDMVGFTNMSSGMSASELVELLNTIVVTFDELCLKFGLEKIKTIGDAYFAVGGLNAEAKKNHPELIIRFGLSMIEALNELNKSPKTKGRKIGIRVGVNTGHVVAGVIGKSKFSFDVWGDSINTASRMESTGIEGKVQITRATYERVHDIFKFEERTGVYVKGKGEMTTYIVQGFKDGVMNNEQFLLKLPKSPMVLPAADKTEANKSFSEPKLPRPPSDLIDINPQSQATPTVEPQTLNTPEDPNLIVTSADTLEESKAAAVTHPEA